MFEQLKQKYVASFDEKVTFIKQALESNDTQALTVLVHQMVGSSGSYGFDGICSLCAEIESMILESNHINKEISQKTTELITAMEKT